MKAVLMSIQPRWCELIASGKKTVEVRKTKPKLEVPFKVYIYCTLPNPKTDHSWQFEPNLYVKDGEVKWIDGAFERTVFWHYAHQRVIGEFVCDRIDEYRYGVYDGEFCYHIPTVEGEKTCLEYDEAEEYGSGKPLYFWHISDLVIYDKPRGVGEFRKPCLPTGLRYDDDAITRPPQSWCYVERRVNDET